jgi:hypothetical protein
VRGMVNMRECHLTTRSSRPWCNVGRVFPRHGHRGRPLNAIVSFHAMSAVPTQNDGRGCPVCGRVPTPTQYVFYPKFLKVRCRGCRTELKYMFPLWKKIVFFMTGAVVAIAGLVAIAVLELTHGVPFLPSAIAYIVAASLLVGYIEARHIQKRYSPVSA